LLIGIPLGAMIALAIASMIGWLILGLPVAAYDPIKMPAFVWYYRGDPQVIRAMAGGLIGGGLLLGGLIYALLARAAPLHGAARFATEREIKRHGFRARYGIVLGRRRGRFLTFSGSEHVMVEAPTRSGKGVGIVIPNLLTWAGSVVVLDVKRENYDASAGFRAHYGQAVYLFNPTDREGRTARYNPLAYIDRRDPDDVIIELQKIGVNGGDRAGMARIDVAQVEERRPVAQFLEQDAIRAHPERAFEQMLRRNIGGRPMNSTGSRRSTICCFSSSSTSTCAPCPMKTRPYRCWSFSMNLPGWAAPRSSLAPFPMLRATESGFSPLSSRARSCAASILREEAEDQSRHEVVHVRAALWGRPFGIVFQQFDIELVEPPRRPNVERTFTDLLDRGDARQRQEEPKMLGELGILTRDGRIVAGDVLRLKRLAIGGEDELSLGRSRFRAVVQSLQRCIDLALRTGRQVDVTALKNTTRHIRLVGIAGAKPLDRRFIPAKR
jgi:hypothetical protein